MAAIGDSQTPEDLLVGRRIEKDIVLALCGGVWPEAEGFDWSMVEYFAILYPGLAPTPGSIQGFDGSGEAIGPLIEYFIRVQTIQEELDSRSP
jgi:hypothetical protein